MMAQKKIIQKLPYNLRLWLDQTLIDNHFTEYQKISEALANKGYSISGSTLRRYGQKFKREFLESKKKAKKEVQSSGQILENLDLTSANLIALIQNEILNNLISIQTTNTMNPAEHIRLLLNAARDTATLTRAIITLKTYHSDLKRIEHSTKFDLEKDIITKVLEPETLRIIRQEIYGIF